MKSLFSHKPVYTSVLVNVIERYSFYWHRSTELKLYKGLCLEIYFIYIHLLTFETWWWYSKSGPEWPFVGTAENIQWKSDSYCNLGRGATFMICAGQEVCAIILISEEATIILRQDHPVHGFYIYAEKYCRKYNIDYWEKLILHEVAANFACEI